MNFVLFLFLVFFLNKSRIEKKIIKFWIFFKHRLKETIMKNEMKIIPYYLFPENLVLIY